MSSCIWTKGGTASASSSPRGSFQFREKKMHDPHGLHSARPDWEAVRVKPPLPPPDGKRPLSPVSYRRSLLTRSPLSSVSPYGFFEPTMRSSVSRPTSPEPPFRCASPPPAKTGPKRSATATMNLMGGGDGGGRERPQSPTPESEVARILSCEIPPKRNSVVNFPAPFNNTGHDSDMCTATAAAAANNTEDTCRFRPISPPPISGCSRPMSPSVERSPSPSSLRPACRPCSPTPPEEEEDPTEESDTASPPLPPPLPKSPPPPLLPHPLQRPSSTPAFTILRVKPLTAKSGARPLSAPGLQGGRPFSPPPAAGGHLRKESRFCSYRPFQTLEEEERTRGQALRLEPERRSVRRRRPEARHTRIEPKLQVPTQFQFEQYLVYPGHLG